MKKLIFLMTIICLSFISLDVKAEEVDFYEAEKIDNIYTKSVNSKETHFQKSRFFRRKSDNQAAYCIEPFSFFYENHKYNNIKDIKDIDDETLKKISLIAYYGYNYDSHIDNKWYAITQLMIWRETNKNDDFYFTDSLNGNKITKYEDEISEINNLVNKHDLLPSFSNQTLNIKLGEKYIIDYNNIIDGFETDNSEVTIANNKIDISKLEPGHYTINFKKILIDRGENILFYYNDESQNLMTLGNTYIPSFTLNINIYKPEIRIEKYDKDDYKIKNDKLCDCTFKIFDINMNEIKEVKLNKDCTANIENIDIGTYYIKEIKSGEGYNINDEIYSVNLSLDDYNKIIKIYNEKIKSKVKIHKDYNYNNINNPEENVIFDIYSGDKYINTITTDYNGNAEITLNYGEYTFKQVSSKEGYNYVEDFKVIINENTDQEIEYNLVDYKIKVPDTHSDKKQINIINIIYILLIILSGLYAKKKIIN